jgi:hypothetical protein
MATSRPMPAITLAAQPKSNGESYGSLLGSLIR